MSALGEEMDILKVNLAATVTESQTFLHMVSDILWCGIRIIIEYLGNQQCDPSVCKSYLFKIELKSVTLVFDGVYFLLLPSSLCQN